MSENRYTAIFHGPVEHAVIGDHNTLVFQYSSGEQRLVPFLAPPLPPYRLVGRDEVLADLRDRLFSGGALGLVALDGLPGIGKTALAVALANDRGVLEHFSDGVLWSGLGKPGDILSHLATWGSAVGISRPDLDRARTVEARATIVHAAIGLRRMLLIVDDAWRVEDALAFRIGGPNCGHVVTTRSPEIAVAFAGAGAFLVPELNDVQSRQLLNEFVGELSGTSQAEVVPLLRSLGGLPLSLVLLGTYLRSEGSHGQKDRLARALGAAGDPGVRLRLKYPVGPLDRHPSLPAGSPISLEAIIGITFDDLRDNEKVCLKRLALFPSKPNTFSETAALHVTDHEPGIFQALVHRRLVEPVRSNRYALHQSLWDFATQFPVDSATITRFTSFFLAALDNTTDDKVDLAAEVLNIHKALELCRIYDQAGFEHGVLGFIPYLMRVGSYNTALGYLHAAENSARTRDVSGDHYATILAELGSVLFRLGAYEEAERTLKAAVTNATTTTKVMSRVFDDLGSLAEKRGQYDQAELFFDEGIRIAERQSDSATLSSLLTQAGWLSISRGRYQEAEARFSTAYEHAETVRRPDLISGVLTNWGWAKIKQGKLAEADGLLTQGLDLAKDINFQERIAALLINLGVSAEKQGDYAKAEQRYRDALVISEKVASPEKASAVLTNLGLLAEYRGAYAEAEEYYRKGLSIARSLGHKERISNVLQNLGSVADYTGRFEEALALNAEALTLAREIGHAERTAALLQERGAILLHADRLAEAHEALREGLELAEALGHNERKAALKGCMAELASRAGDHDRALTYLAEADQLATAIGHRWHATYLLLARGEVELARDRVADAQAAFEKALESAEKLASHAALAESHFGLARCAMRTGDRENAYFHGVKSRQLFGESGHYKAATVSEWLRSLDVI